MKKLFLLICFIPFLGYAHPGIGIVQDSKGNIFYTDLKQVWKISRSKQTIAVPQVHTHELYMDATDKLYGEGGYYNAQTKQFFHYMWVYKPDGTIDTAIGMRPDFIQLDFSFAKDKMGNEYYTKQFLKRPDTLHLFRRSPQGKETVWATGNFKGVSWLHPQPDGTVLYVQGNALYRVSGQGNITLVKDGLAGAKPLFAFSGHRPTVWSAWKDHSGAVYVAAFSDQAVKKIDAEGRMQTVYRSKDNWAPLHGLFDQEDRLWVLEGSDKNEVRVTLAASRAVPIAKEKMNEQPLRVGLVVLLAVVVRLFGSNRLKTKFRTLKI